MGYCRYECWCLVNCFVVTGEGFIIVSDNNDSASPSGNSALNVFDQNGLIQWKIGTEGDKRYQFKDPSGLAITTEGLLIIADSENNRIQMIDFSHL